ncbi:MAG: hypothetical protein PUF50_03055 [Erysipelotrichaceae bacterium]|nr:hypothetical protein [Erysipelotrichaceae bacterium]
MDKYICIKQLETNTDDGEHIIVRPGSVWLMKPRTYWNHDFSMTNEARPEWKIDVSDTVFNMCFKRAKR